LTQDGRLVLEALPNALGSVVWGEALPRDPFVRAAFEKGLVAILTRFVVQATPGPFSATAKLEVEARHRIAFTTDERLVLDVTGDLYAPIGKTYGQTAGDGERALAGHVFAEHTFTRLFAPPGQRRVGRAEVAGLPPVTDVREASPDSALSLPPGATALEPELRLDGVPFTFGLMHTDSNMHVNSLVYLRMFEEAAIRRFVELGKGAAWLGRYIDIRYRKPCFAGQTMHVVQRAFAYERGVGVVAGLVPNPTGASTTDGVDARPRTFVQMLFEA
jgi:hypothetical protein